MISTNNLTLRFGARTLFSDVSIKFSAGNCYGLIGANGAGKSTFLKLLSGEISSTSGDVSLPPNQRLAMLRQDQDAYNNFKVLDTVIMGHKKLYEVLKERDEIYSKEEFSEKDGIRASELEEKLGEMNGWDAESEAAIILKGLGLSDEFHVKKMKELTNNQKVRVLLAQALFGNPDILLLDEPSNGLDLESVIWLENFLSRFENTVIVVSHDRHFLNNVCTHIADIDRRTIKIYVGNYDFWVKASEMALKQLRDENRKKEDKMKDLKEFISRFSSNASKARQATSRKKLLDKLSLEDIPMSTRKYPYINFKIERECGNVILEIEKLSKSINGSFGIKDFSLTINKNDKIAFIGGNDLAKTMFFDIITGNVTQDNGTIKWGETVTKAYFPKNNKTFFDSDMSLVDWLAQYSDDKSENFVRGFLGRMLFTQDESLKKVNVLSGGERVRMMLSKMMLTGSNVLILDDPLSHLDLESITSLNNSLIGFSQIILFASHDIEFVSSVANRIIEFTPKGVIDKYMNFEEYLEDKNIKELRDKMYGEHVSLT